MVSAAPDNKRLDLTGPERGPRPRSIGPAAQSPNVVQPTPGRTEPLCSATPDRRAYLKSWPRSGFSTNSALSQTRPPRPPSVSRHHRTATLLRLQHPLCPLRNSTIVTAHLEHRFSTSPHTGPHTATSPTPLSCSIPKEPNTLGLSPRNAAWLQVLFPRRSLASCEPRKADSDRRNYLLHARCRPVPPTGAELLVLSHTPNIEILDSYVWRSLFPPSDTEHLLWTSPISKNLSTLAHPPNTTALADRVPSRLRHRLLLEAQRLGHHARRAGALDSEITLAVEASSEPLP